MIAFIHQRIAGRKNPTDKLSPPVDANPPVCDLLIAEGLDILLEHNMKAGKLSNCWSTIVTMYEAKQSSYQIAKHFGVSAVSIRNGLLKRNVKIRSRKEGVVLAVQQNRIRRADHKGSNNPAWKGTPVKQGGYLFLHRPNHPRAAKNGYVGEAVVLVEAAISRNLTNVEVVHHIDRNPLNNSIDNLQVLTRSEHAKLHARSRGAGILIEEGMVKA